MSLITVIRTAIKKDPRSMYAIAKAAKLPYSTVHRFVRLERSALGLVTADKLCRALGLELVQVGQPQPMMGTPWEVPVPRKTSWPRMSSFRRSCGNGQLQGA